MNLDRTIGEQLHTIMWRRRITQASVAAAIGIDSTALGRKLRGTRGWSSSDLVGVAGILGVEFQLDEHGCAIRDLNPEPADSMPGVVLMLHGEAA